MSDWIPPIPEEDKTCETCHHCLEGDEGYVCAYDHDRYDSNTYDFLGRDVTRCEGCNLWKGAKAYLETLKAVRKW